MKKIFLLFFTLVGLSQAKAQISFTGEYTNNFDGFTSAATIPAGWAMSGSGGFVGTGTGSSTTGGFYSFNPTCCPTDHSLGALHSGSATGSYTATFVNSTGSTITSLSISYDFEQYKSANTSGWDVRFNGVINAALGAAGVSGVTVGTPYVLNKSTTLTGLSIAPGASFTMQWTVNDVASSDNPVAVDNFKMCVPGAAFSVTASNSSPTTAPAPVTFTGSASLGAPTYTYNWLGPVSYSAAGASPVISPSSISNSGVYTVTVTDAAGCTAKATTTVTVNPGSSCSGTPVSGTAVATPASFCVSGLSTLTVTGASAVSGLTYQWQSSTTGTIGSFTDISGATSVIYNTPAVSTTTYYRLVTTCPGSGLSDTSSNATVTINALPAIIATPAGGSICAGGSGLSMAAAGGTTYTWAPAAGLSATTGATVTANPTSNTTYTITGTNTATGCSSTTTATVTYNLAPSPITFTPSPVSLCEGGAPQLVTALGGTAGPTTVNSGTITIPGTIANLGTISTALTMAGVPAGATITGASVNIINFGSQFQDDYIINIQAPNGNTLNLIKQIGTHISTAGTLFGNTSLSSASATPITSGSGTYTGTWAAQAISAVGGAPYTSNVTAWGSLFSIPNGTWTLAIYNTSPTFGNTVVPTAQWSITLNYTYSAPVTWSPTTNLYTDAAATIPYTGGAASAVYVNPVAVSTLAYTATANNSGCTSAASVTASVNPLPAAIAGTLNVCEGLTTALTDATADGTWSPDATANTTIDASGIVTGVLAGTATITYTSPTGCTSTAEVTVNALPSAIGGTLAVCQGLTTTLTDAGSGTWASGNTANATVDASGVVTGVLAGTSTITYTLGTGCTITTEVTVNPLPDAIAGTLSVCEGLTTTLTDATADGTWSSSITTANAVIDASGIVTGVLAGTSTITYTLPTGCISTAVVTVNALPSAIGGTLAVCEGLTTTLTDAGSGTWASGTTANATVDASGVVTGVLAGTSTITYTLGTGCTITTEVTVNPLPDAIAGTLSVCEGLTTTLTDATADGTWSSSITANATIDASGVVTGVLAGMPTITYTLPTGCISTAVVTVNALPSAIGGTLAICEGLTTTLIGAGSGTWISGTTANATVDASGVVTGVLAGTSTITYTLGTGCTVTAEVTVNPLPADIAGALSVCEGLTATLTDATADGTWSSSNANATINPTTGLATGAAAGTATITYTATTGCIATAALTINPLPSAITGTASVCISATTTLFSPGGGTWASNNGNASVDAPTGIVTGNIAGTSVITYTLPTGCTITTTVTVNALPDAISGTTSVCVGAAITLTDAGGGTWASSNGNASAGATTGIVTGNIAGTSVITYTLGTGCISTKTITINALPSAITGTAEVCAGNNTTLFSPGGGTWASGNANASIGSSTGIVTGNTAGTSVITYTLSTGCSITRAVTVDPLPSAITGTAVICVGATTTLADAGGGTWASSNSNAIVGITTGIATGIAAGTSIITYRLSTGCLTTRVITINALPTPFIMAGGGSYCDGGAGMSVGLGNSATGISYQLYNGAATVDGPVPGSGLPIDFGLQTAAGTYSVIATNTTTGCTRNMSGTVAVTITPLVTPSVDIATGFGDTVCSGLSITFTAVPVNGGSAPTYQWAVNGAVVGTAAGTYVYTPADHDTVSVTVTSSAACATPSTATHADTMAVITSTTPALTITATPGTHVCAGTPITFTTFPVNGGPTPSFLWTQNDTNVATGPTYTIASGNGDVVYCRMYSSSLCSTVDSAMSDTLHIVTDLPGAAPVVTLSVSPGTTIVAGTSVTFTAAVTGSTSAVSYEWLVNGVPVPGATSAAYTSSTFANGDAVTCVATNNTACLESGNHTVTIAVSGLAVGSVPNQGKMGIFPNPNTGTFSIQGAGLDDGRITIEMADIVGHVVYSNNLAVVDGTVNTQISVGNALANGVYLLTVRSASATTTYNVTISR